MADIENQFPADRSYDPLDKKIAQYKAARGVYAKFGKLDLLEKAIFIISITGIS